MTTPRPKLRGCARLRQALSQCLPIGRIGLCAASDCHAALPLRWLSWHVLATGGCNTGRMMDRERAMQGFSRYAVYYAPEPGPLADFTARWLGWDPVEGVPMPQPLVAGLPRDVGLLTQAPRKYGFHGTVKPPFRLADGADVSDLHAALAALCPYLAPLSLAGLSLDRIDGFVALTPLGDQTPLAAMAAEVVRALDGYRAPPDEAEIARRRPDRLTPRQRGYLSDWGYPYVMDEFRFHLTLTGDLPDAEASQVQAVLAPIIEPLLPTPFRIASLCLFGESADGRFRLLDRLPLTGG